MAKNTQAKGGEGKIKAITSLRKTGKMRQGPFAAQVAAEAKAPTLFRETLTIQGMTQIQAYDGATGRRVSPFGGRKDPELLGEDDLRDVVEDADFYGPLIDYKQKGNSIEYLGPATVDGDDAYRLKVTLKNGDIIYYYLDPDTFLEIRTEKQQFIRGAVSIDPSNPKIVWVGTGESWTRNSVAIGDGVYKSTDGGETWANVGLKDSERIAKILVDPKDGNTVYVCATGHLWDDSQERGVYRTIDGGKSWRKVLPGANGSTGCATLAMSAQEPKTLYAALWDFRRMAWTFRSGGPGSGIFKSSDGGENWTELNGKNSKGLPDKHYGRIALAVAPSKPKVVYAMIESKKSALFRSDDGGENWKPLDASQYMIWRPFYFANLIVDPKDENKVFKVDAPLLLSVNGGSSFSNVSGGTHGDFQLPAINRGLGAKKLAPLEVLSEQD